MEEQDIQKFIQLVNDGKDFKTIYREHFESQYKWPEVHAVINEYNLKTVLGAKQSITKNMNTLKSSATPQQIEIINETRELVDFIYSRYKECRDKLDKM